jgi:site-specific recombinase XerD
MADEDEEWLFPNSRSETGHVDSMKKAFRRIVKAAGLDPKKIIPHTMRHTAITDVSGTGADFRTIQAFSGHKSTEMVMRYIHAREERIDEALDLMDGGTNVEQLDAPAKQRS